MKQLKSLSCRPELTPVHIQPSTSPVTACLQQICFSLSPRSLSFPNLVLASEVSAHFFRRGLSFSGNLWRQSKRSPLRKRVPSLSRRRNHHCERLHEHNRIDSLYFTSWNNLIG